MTARAQAGDRSETERRFEELYRRHEARVLGYALRRAPVDAAKDAVSETFLAAWRRFDELPPDPLPWLIGATRRTLANQRRSSARQLLLIERLAREPVREVSSREEGTTSVVDAFAQLAAADQELLALVAWDGLTTAQAAASLGCSAVAFRVRLHRARHRLAAGLARASAASQPEVAREQQVPKAKEAP